MKPVIKRFLVIGLMIAAFAVGAGLLASNMNPDVKVVPPTCTEKGYTVYTVGGKTQMRDLVEATGHTFSDWQITHQSSGVAGGQRVRHCTSCGLEESEIFHEEKSLPQIYLSGDMAGIGKKEQVAVTAEFEIDDIVFDGYALLKYQGHSSLQYPKKNYTVKFFADEQCDEKQKFEFSHWNKENKYILKANYNDVSHSRNLICADLWSAMVASRQKIHPRLEETSNLGAVDGFPVELYINDSFQGVYNVTLHKDDGLFAMEDGQQDGIVITNETDTPASFFKEKIDWETTPDWEVEYCGTEDTAWLTEKTNEFVDFVINSTDETFRNELGKHADVESLIDYLIAVYVMGLPDNGAKDVLLATYENDVFIASLFDMESAFGLKRDGSGFYEPDYGLPVTENGVLTSGTQSLLWDRLLRNFRTQICSRYQQLRTDILSEQNILAVAREKIEAIPAELSDAEFELYPEQPHKEISHLEQIETYSKQRLSLLDKVFAELSKEGTDNEN